MPSDEAIDDPAGSSLHREPSLHDRQDILPTRPDLNEFDPDLPDEADDDAVQRRALDRSMRRIARQAALDPGDGMV